MINNQVRWGIAGLGQIAHRFAQDLTQHVSHASLVAVAARDALRASQFAEHYNVAQHYNSYLALAQDPNIDAVYIATINPCHKEVVELCLNNGKHVLVEKPAFCNVADWDSMTALAKQNNVLLVEAMKSITFPAYRSLRQFIIEHNVTVDYVEAAYGSHNTFDPKNRLFNPNINGGATLDVGVYPLWLYADLCQLTNASIEKPQVTFTKDNAESAVDENVEFRFSGDVAGLIRASITQELPREAIIRGPEFEAIIQDKWWNPKSINIVYQGQTFHLEPHTTGGGFEFEAQHVSELILNNQQQSDQLPPATSRQVIALMEESLIEHGFGVLVR